MQCDGSFLHIDLLLLLLLLLLSWLNFSSQVFRVLMMTISTTLGSQKQ